jgi:hypothetical protein
VLLQHEIAAKLAAERAAAEERAKQELARFGRGKPLYEKVGRAVRRAQQASISIGKRVGYVCTGR